jgi:serpin B
VLAKRPQAVAGGVTIPGFSLTQGANVMKCAAVLSCLVSILVLAVAGAEQSDRQAPAAVQTVVQGNNAFAFDLYARLRDKPGNLFYSPYSISTALAMTSAGARGETAEEMARVLHFSLEGGRLHPAFAELIREHNGQGLPRKYQLNVAQALWGDRTLHVRPEFQDLLQKRYDAQLRLTNFLGDPDSARRQINQWVEEQTQDKIKDLLHKDDIDALTRMVLVNAIYFKAAWQNPFNPKLTNTDALFHAAGKDVKTALMRQTEAFRYAEDEAFQAIELPYKGNELSMVVLLPREKDGLAKLEQSLSAAKLDGWLSKLKTRQVAVELPRFKIEARVNLASELMNMGMRLAFSPMADFSGISSESLMISKVIHQAFVDVNEAGTEAAAATAVVVMRASDAGTPAVFKADHPFVFLLRDQRTGSILFLGRVTDPS